MLEYQAFVLRVYDFSLLRRNLILHFAKIVIFLVVLQYFKKDTVSHPAWGAWIETGAAYLFGGIACVAPRVGCVD